MSDPISAAQGVRVQVEGHELVSFAGCDTLGLARHPDVVAAAARALERCGVGASASRTTTGTWTEHVELEAELAAWLGTDDAVVLPAGWLAPGALAAALAPAHDTVRCDADAHGVGVLGAHGRGAADAAGIPGVEFHLAGSFSKALGCHGGFVAAPRAVCDVVRSLPEYSGATPVPPAIAAAARAALALARDGAALRERLTENVARLRGRFTAIGLPPPADDVPWFCIRDRSATELQHVADGLLAAGFLAPRTEYHGAPEGGIVRIAPTAAHTEADIDALGDALARLV